MSLDAGIDEAFAYLDRFEALSAHMEKRSPMMLGGIMRIDTDERGGRAIGSKVRMSGRVPRFKAWETREVRLLAIGHYRLGFELVPAGDGTGLTVFIDFQPPEWPAARWLGRICTDLCALVHPPHGARRYGALRRSSWPRSRGAGTAVFGGLSGD